MLDVCRFIPGARAVTRPQRIASHQAFESLERLFVQPPAADGDRPRSTGGRAMSTNISPPPNRWAAAAPRKQLVVGMGDMLTSNDTAATLVTYSLGSCVGVAIYDPVAKVGGLLHAMLPDSTINLDRASKRPFMFVDTGLPAMFHAVYALGGLKHRLVFKIGQRNVEATVAMLERNGVKISGRETGGRESRTVKLDLSNGNFTLDIPGKAPYLL
jgi:chemotaxis protein CheD